VKHSAAQRGVSKSGGQTAAGARPREKGYILLTLVLVIALLGIFALAVTSKIDFQIRRDQEQEMIHRGVQYSRAIRGYYKKFGRYPTKLEDLDNTNNLRYLRKHYKDPLNKNREFRLLHFGEPGVTLAGGLAGGSIPGASPAGSPPGLSGGPGLGNTGVNSSGVFAQSSGANSNSQATAGQAGATPAPGSDPTQASAQVAAGTAQGDTSSSSQQIVASGPIVGVASISRKETIREFNKKKKYNEWQFVYDPTFDRGGIITTPYQPSVLSGISAQNNLQPGAAGSSTSSQSSFGQSSSGFGNSSTTGGSTSPAQPATTPPQQQ